MSLFIFYESPASFIFRNFVIVSVPFIIVAKYTRELKAEPTQLDDVNSLIPAWIIKNHALALNCKWFQEYSASFVYCSNFIWVIFHAFLALGDSVNFVGTPSDLMNALYISVYCNWIIGVKGKRTFTIRLQFTWWQMIFILISSTFFVAQFFIFIIVSSPDYSSFIMRNNL